MGVLKACVCALVLGFVVQNGLLARINPSAGAEAEHLAKQLEIFLGANSNGTQSNNPLTIILEGIRQGFMRVLGSLTAQEGNLPGNVVNSTRVIMQLATNNSLDFSQLISRLPLLSLFSPRRQFQEVLKLLRPSEGTFQEEFFQAANGVLDYVRSPAFTETAAKELITAFPSIIDRMRDIMTNVLEAVGIGVNLSE